MKVYGFIGLLILLFLIIACQPDDSPLATAIPSPTSRIQASSTSPNTQIPRSNSLPPTWTPEPTAIQLILSSTPPPQRTQNLTARVTAEALNIRTGPANDFGIIAQLTNGQTVPIIGVSDNGRWYLVEYGFASQGWLFADLVEVNGSLDGIPNRQPTPINGEQAVVVRIIDGDTIDVRINGVQQRVRYVGVNTPERDEPCYQEATNYNSSLVQGQEITLVKDTSETDQYGRLLRYIYVGNMLVNRELVKNGYAEAVLYDPDDAFFTEFSNLEYEASRQNLACHASGIFEDGSNTR